MTTTKQKSIRRTWVGAFTVLTILLLWYAYHSSKIVSTVKAPTQVRLILFCLVVVTIAPCVLECKRFHKFSIQAAPLSINFEQII